MASAQRLCLHRAPPGAEGRRHVQDVVPEFTTDQSHAFGGRYVEPDPGERLHYTDTFDNPNLPRETQVTVILKRVSIGNDLSIVQASIPDAIPVEACYLGWQESLNNLVRLVAAEINQ
jgi:uncharacterized protein YndB with AHSA1/START domain